jgi:hydrogenase-4 component E
MNNTADMIMVFLVLTNLALLGLSRLGACIRLTALQGVALGILPLALNQWNPDLHLAVFSAVLVILKGIVFPFILMRTLRELNVQREVEPFIGYGTSIGLGTAALVSCMWLSSRLPLPAAMSALTIPVAFFTIMTGLFLIITRKKAITQVLGYLVLENGIYAFGAALVVKQPVLIELGILLDVFVAVFVMGIAIFHINREFDHIDTDKLSGLRT